MGIRKNAKLLAPAEIENFVKACVLMKADIVNPAALAANRYSKWDEYVAIHWMIQDALAPGPGGSNVNFGHGGISAGAYSFLSWHRFFLREFEKQLQTYVPGVMLPYWDWTNPSTIMTATFMGPNGTTNREVRSGYFARNAPGTAGNVTPAPVWWPATLTGWLLPAAFGTVYAGALRRSISTPPGLPSVTDLTETLTKADYRNFAWALESGTGLTSTNQMHNGMHGWIGGGTLSSPGHMSDPSVSPFDPFFYLHHCNIDRLWAMWQLDGHATEYPAAGALPHHGPTALMYPWVGGAAGYGTNVTIGTGAANIPMPNVAAVGAKQNDGTLDFRTTFGYTYDSIAIIGVGLDRTGSMTGLTPDPMTSSAPDVSKWEAAKRGVSLFLQDCETVQNSRVTYVHAGVKTFRRLVANDFTQVFPGTGFGLVKTGGTVSRAAFDAAIAPMTPGGGTPLADALLDVQATMVQPPFGGLPADERRYLAMLTDGLLTAGAPFSSIPNGSLTRTAVFAMGFGTGAEVDYATLQTMVDKGVTLSTQQLFHGENAGTIDKFYTNALARAMGFTAVFDPLIQLFATEHTHVEFNATSADDAFFITAQGMDFVDDNWRFHLMSPDGSIVYADPMDEGHGKHGAQHGCGHCCRTPHATTMRGNGRLTVMLQRDSADDPCWVGTWKLLAAYKTRRTDIMMMPSLGAVLFPLSAGPARGPRYSRLLQPRSRRLAQRSIVQAPRHGLDHLPVATNRSEDACDLVVNIYAQTRLQLELTPEARVVGLGKEFGIKVVPQLLQGAVTDLKGFARLAGPAVDLSPVLKKATPDSARKEADLVRDGKVMFDPAIALANLENRNRKLAHIRDEELAVVVHGGPMHVHTKADVPGAYHVNLYVEGAYYPGGTMSGGHGHGGDHSAPFADGEPQLFSRILSTMVVIDSGNRPQAASARSKAAGKVARKKGRRR